MEADLFSSAGGLEQDRALSVTEITRCLKELLEGSVRPCWIRGEISNLRQQASGHVYFSLKDAGAQISAVMFRGDALRQRIALRDGMQVLAYGSVSVYEARGQYQWVVRLLTEDGKGRLQQDFELLKSRLSAEGLFDAERKLPIPAMPATVGFITSPTGAAVQDFVRILLRRNWRGRLVVLPAKVQGPGAAQEMVEQLRVARDAGIFDLLVIGRGGGSMEDLWSFNEEPLVRAVAACEIPIISAVGHEIDFTLCDFAADFRAETPSAAAELISSHFLASVEKLGGLIDSMERVLENFAETSRARLEHAESRLRLLSPDKQIEHGFLRIDDLGNRLVSVLRQTADVKRRDLVQALHRFERVSPQSRVEKESHRLLSLWKRLQSASPKSVLNRGFVILRDETGKPLTKSSQAKPGKRLRGQFADGEVPLKVDADPGKSA